MPDFSCESSSIAQAQSTSSHTQLFPAESSAIVKHDLGLTPSRRRKEFELMKAVVHDFFTTIFFTNGHFNWPLNNAVFLNRTRTYRSLMRRPMAIMPRPESPSSSSSDSEGERILFVGRRAITDGT